MTTATLDLSAPEHLLRALLNDAGRSHYLEVRLIGDEAVRQHFLRVDDVLRHGLPRSIRHADGRANVYFGVVPRVRPRGRGEDCGPALAVWADFDQGAPRALPLAPSITVESSPGKFQALWLLDEPCADLAIIEAINRRVAATYGADSAACDRARVLRLPGFVNLKYPDRPRARLLRCDGSARYSIRDLEAAFPPLEEPRRLPSQRTGSAPAYLTVVFEAIFDHLVARGARWRRNGEGVLIQCPFHPDSDPSLSMHPVRGWHCFAQCGEGRLTALAHRLGIKLLEGAA